MSPPGLAWGWADVGDEGPSAAGRRAAEMALGQLGPELGLAYDGARPIVIGAEGVVISISHGRRRAVAVAGRFARLGVDLCEHDRAPRIRALAPRFLSTVECALIGDERSTSAVWAAKEAGLKALALGLDEGGVLDEPARCPVQIGSLDPPRFDAPEGLVLVLDERDGCALAVAYTPPSTTTVAPFM